MINFFRKPKEKVFNLSQLDADSLLFKVFPRLFMELMKKYFRLEIEGLENIPKKGPVIIAPNHSGFSGFDAMILAYILQDQTKRIPRVLTHHLWFLTEKTALPAQKLGFIEATFENGISLLKKNNVIVLFPEGANGNFKATYKKYQLQEFKRGFIRMALQTGAVIVPTLVIGAEETHINLQKLKFSKFLRGLVLPLPLNVIPLPAKWKIVFTKPIHLPFGPEKIDDSELCHELANEIQESMQKKINKLIKQRGSAYFPVLILAALIGFTTKVQAQAVDGFRCVPSFRDTRFQVAAVDQKIEIRITNPSGYKFMPQFDGPFSQFDGAFNEMQAKDLEGLGNSFTIKWPKENCKMDTGKFTLSCSGISEISVPAMKSYGLTTTEITESYENKIYEKRKFRISLEKDNIYFVSLKFDTKTCEKF